ncbi:hypothetical protein [Roseicyclus sp.]|uniref:hypothetical protein n=1 Tax=Roseicyclus sp. TaxID=1914329 RepID=UPI003F6C1EB1
MTIERDADQFDQLLRQARGGEPVSSALSARVLADAAMVQAAMHPAPPRQPRFGWLAQISAALGGWPALSGVTLAGIAGLTLGILAPDLVDGLSGGQIGVWTGDLGALPEIGLLWEDASDV